MRTMPQVRSFFSTMFAGSIGTVKLGQPDRLSYLLTDANSGSPETMST